VFLNLGLFDCFLMVRFHHAFFSFEIISTLQNSCQNYIPFCGFLESLKLSLARFTNFELLSHSQLSFFLSFSPHPMYVCMDRSIFVKIWSS
jgi:hypothetical protein